MKTETSGAAAADCAFRIRDMEIWVKKKGLTLHINIVVKKIGALTNFS